MIYFDNSATTLIKPKEVCEAVVYAMNHFGNAGRSFYDCTMEASRAVYGARDVIAKFACVEDALSVAFTSSATESLNLVINGLIDRDDHVITTVAEHNSVLRPIFNSKCEVSFIECDEKGVLLLDNLDALLRANTKCVVATHASNLTGNISDIALLKDFCESNNLIFVLDASQTFGGIETKASYADIICFTGHKALLGPQGTGGIICNIPQSVKITKTGGTGSNSFDQIQPHVMPDMFESGTANSHGLNGLRAGVEYVISRGVNKIHEEEMILTNAFIKGISNVEGIEFYGDIFAENRMPIVSVNIETMSSDEVAMKLWQEHSIATRPGSHCAPLLHKHFGTEERGIVRFSFSHFNTIEEIEKGISAIKKIASER